MGRGQNPFHYQDPMGDIGSSLVTAIFGDPAARAKQQQMQAELAERQAHARLYNSQADGVGIQNTASSGLPALMASMAPRPAPTPIPVAIDPVTQAPLPDNLDAAFDSSVGPQAHGETTLQAYQRGLPAVLAAMGQMNGDKIDPRQIIGTLGAFGGDDELARRSLIAQGHTPGKDFATNPYRADQISARDAGEAQAQAWGVADRNHKNDIPVANIRRGSAFDVATVGARSRENVAGIAAGSRETVAGIKAGGTAPGFDAIQRVFPGVQPNSGWRSVEHNREVGGVPNSTHLGLTPGVQGYDLPVQPGMTVREAAARIEAANPGVKVVEARDERGRVGPNGKALGGWHFALANVGGGGKPAAAAKPANASTLKSVNDAVDMVLQSHGLQIDPKTKQYQGTTAAATARTYLREQAAAMLPQAGNPTAAARMAWEKMQSDAKITRDRRAAQGGAQSGGWGKATVVR